MPRDDKFRRGEPDASWVLCTQQPYACAEHKLALLLCRAGVYFHTGFHYPGIASQCGYQVPRCCLRCLELTWLWHLPMLFTELVSALCPPAVSRVRSSQGRAHNQPLLSEDHACVTKNHISFIFFSHAIKSWIICAQWQAAIKGKQD